MPDMTPEDLQDLLWTFAQHRVLTVAARAGILHRLADSEATPDQVARDLDLDPNATAKVVKALHALGMLKADGNSYRVVDGLAPRFAKGPGDITPFFEHSHSMYDGWGKNLEPWLHGEPWPTGASAPTAARSFGAAMRAIGSESARMTATMLDASHARTMLDVGGGFGQYSIAFCQVNPHLSATVLDTPEVTKIARIELAGSEFEQRISFVGGDYLAPGYGSGYDLVLIANVLHQERPPGAQEMIRRSANALAPGGRVAIVDFQIDDHQRENVFGTLFAINMRSFGDTYTEPVIRDWMSDAGLHNISRTDLNRHKWIIVGHKP